MRIFGKYRDKQSKKRSIFDNKRNMLELIHKMTNNINKRLW